MTDPNKTPKKPAELPELNIDVTEMVIRIGRAKASAADARAYVAKIIKLCDALDTLAK